MLQQLKHPETRVANSLHYVDTFSVLRTSRVACSYTTTLYKSVIIVYRECTPAMLPVVEMHAENLQNIIGDTLSLECMLNSRGKIILIVLSGNV